MAGLFGELCLKYLEYKLRIISMVLCSLLLGIKVSDCSLLQIDRNGDEASDNFLLCSQAATFV
ncbi:unnamed protein product [Moneuplotes crassus]|uniref:Uncharacterized protein n=1 Tax=Euplotes crassus TaxID=5936 RepID=A0AAD2D1L7_EUPCR|nr:unnamed protein product [Moneuplotes crassus]